jgi:nucleoside phosphorylase
MSATFTHGFAVLSHFAQAGDRSAISEIINMGIAGGLRPDIETGKIFSIRNVLHEEGLKAYPADSSSTIDCITALNRVLDDDYSRKLALKAPLVDRELWAVAHMAQIYDIPFRSWKLVSDHAGSTTDTATIKKNASRYSEQLFSFFKTLM